MDADIKAPNEENGTKIDDSSPRIISPSVEINGTPNDSPKHTIKTKRGQTRSRSRTPQNKAEEAKKLQVNLKKIDTELNGKDLIEETEKTDEKCENAKVKSNVKNKVEVAKEEATKKEEDVPIKEKHLRKQKGEIGQENNKIEDSLEDKSKNEPTPKKEEPGNTDELKNGETTNKEKKDKKHETTEVAPESVVEMDPLVLSDEPDPELQFDENSDLESGKGSPVIPRCITRRSQTRNIPTPKTPKSVEQDVDSEKNSVAPTPTDLIENDVATLPNENDIDSKDNTANLSTIAAVGSDVTRMDYVENHDSSLADDTSYLNASRERTLSETLRSLSARRPIRHTDDYRKRVLRSNQEKSDLNLPYPSRDPVEHIHSGTKRKGRSITPEDRKKFKTESTGLFSSPLANIRNKFRSDLPSSTPKLLGYRNNNSEHTYGDDRNCGNGEEKKSWCSIM